MLAKSQIRAPASLSRMRLIVGALLLSPGFHALAIGSAANPLRDYYSAPLTEALRRAYPQAESATANVDVPYGLDDQQKYDVYLPQQRSSSPIILMIHGGNWIEGDKQDSNTAAGKAGHWTSKGYIFISANYRLAQNPDPLLQAADIASAIAHIQTNASKWGGNPKKIILMGHAAGGHLAALLSSNPNYAADQGAVSWAGAVILDTEALDVPSLMNSSHLQVYDRVFGADEAYWQDTSPKQTLSNAAIPMLIICSTQSQADSCGKAEPFRARASELDVQAIVVPQNLSPDEINSQLGTVKSYTDIVDGFIASLQ